MADPRQHIGLGVRRAIGQLPGLQQFTLAFSALGDIAKHREEIRTVGPGASQGHRQRDDAALADPAQHVAAVIEQACSIGPLDAVQMIQHRRLAFRREQLNEIALRELSAIVAEQRLGAAVAKIDVAIGIELHDAFGGGVEDGAKFLGIGLAHGRRCAEGDEFGKHGDRGGGLVARARENQSASIAGAPSEEASVPEIVTGLPVSDVLLALETPGST